MTSSSSTSLDERMYTPARRATCDVGMIGLAVMGRNLALNIADHGYVVAAYNRTTSVTHDFLAENPPEVFGESGGGIIGCAALEAFIAALRPPRVIIVLVKAGGAIDAVCEQLIDAGLEPDDIVVDAGNSLWTDTIRREKAYRGRLMLFGSGVSGGETGARFGPSLMPGGDQRAWARLKPIWEAVAAKVDPKTGRPLQGAAPGRPITGGEPCTAYIGSDGAGHYVKMVHNGIEYADMQLIAEAYHLLRHGLNAEPAALGDIFRQWNEGELESFLIEITADILKQRDPVTNKPFVDVVLDKAGQKGTGKWTAVNALDLGIPAMSITEAVFARAVSALKDERVHAAEILFSPSPPGRRVAVETRGAGGEGHSEAGGNSPSPCPLPEGEGSGFDPADFIEAVRDALYCSKICAYAQGFQLLREAQREYDWQLNFGEIARIWRGGCIIRARFLQKITEAYQRDPQLTNLLLDPFFSSEIARRQDNWRMVVQQAIARGVPAPAFASSIAYFDSYRSATLPANLIQAQRDYFGSHTYERTDQPRGKFFHLDWPHPDRPQVEA